MNINTKYEYTSIIIIEVLQNGRTIEMIHIFHKIQMQLEKIFFLNGTDHANRSFMDDNKWWYNG